MKLIAWIPMLDGDERSSADQASAIDHTSPQYWDGAQQLGRALAGAYGIDRPVWDAYLFYPPGVTWSDPAPLPRYVLVQAGGAVIGTPDTLPAVPDQTGLKRAWQGRAVIVGEQEELEDLLARVADKPLAR